MTDIRWLWYVTSACWWQRGSAKTGVPKLVCQNWCAKTAVPKLLCDRTSHPLCFESEINTRKGWGIT
ncbi:hypothetical protein QUB37_11565 [Microcoleus sp. AT3-A2]|uniref:hypothetical protein n=1 Tax=unclassified Microcoleus TaxID=2642155 RepID=UPI002FD797CC